MKRRSREISIFNMSTIDLFACATGAFILLTLILMPYYLNIDRSYLDDIAALEQIVAQRDDQIRDLERELSACEARFSDREERLSRVTTERDEARANLELGLTEAEALQEELAACSAVQKRNFLLVTMSWGTADDIDLHVVDPAGNRFFYKTRSHASSAGGLELDSTRGPGNEIWLHPEAEPGEYRVYYNFFERQSDESTVTVRGTVYHQRDSIPIDPVVLTDPVRDNHERAQLAVTIFVSENGDIDVR